MITRRSGTILIYTLLIASGSIGLVIEWLSTRNAAIIAACVVSIIVHGGLLFAELRWGVNLPQVSIIMATLVIGVLIPEQFVLEISAIAMLIPPVLAMIFTGPAWIIGSATGIWTILVWRAGGQGIYVDPHFVSVYMLLIMGLLLSRMMMRAAQHDAQAALIHAEHQRSALERANAALAESDARLRRIIADNPLPMMIHAEDGEIVQINAAWTELSGYTHADIPTTAAWADRAYGARGPIELANINKLYSLTDRIDEGEDRIMMRNGAERVWQFSSAPLGALPDGRRIVISSAADVTERKRAQEALIAERAVLAQRVDERTLELRQANSELERALRLRDEFLAVMSHELRTPLTSVLGFTEMLQAEAYGTLTERQRHVLQTIAQNGNHLLALISNILDFARISAGQLELDHAPVMIDELCESALQLVRGAAQKRQIQIETRIDADIDGLVGDELRLRQVLVNLLDNAVKFTPPHGRIGLEVQRDDQEPIVCFCVWDTGIGIADDQMQRIFLPFVQVEGGLTRPYEGTGLGLALVYQLARMHGGSVSVVSELRRGSRFTVRLPLVRGADRQQSRRTIGANPVFAAAEKRTTLLIVDDHSETVELFSELFERVGHRVVAVQSGEEALAQAALERPDVVMIDIQMPGMDGLEVIRRLRAAPASATVPIVAVTALSLPEDRERCLAAGADSYLTKPVSLQELQRTVERLIQRS
jgi:PAS domain S-box-containing protein